MLSDRARVVWALGSYENAAFVSLSPVLESAFQWFSIVLISSPLPILLQRTPMMSAPSWLERDHFFGVMSALCLGQRDICSQLPREKANTIHCTLWLHLLIALNGDKTKIPAVLKRHLTTLPSSDSPNFMLSRKKWKGEMFYGSHATDILKPQQHSM